jgi:hypothetical protein
LGQQALDDNDLNEASRQFQEVRRALDVLGRDDARALALRQTAAEITASADLTRTSLYEILREAVTTSTGKGRHDAWSDTFQSSYHGEWVVIDANVSRLQEESGGRKFQIDFPLVHGMHRATVVGDLPCFERVVAGGSPQRVIFAAQLEEVSPKSAGSTAWQVVLRPATAFLWSASGNLARIGFETDEATERLLASQSSAVGVIP